VAARWGRGAATEPELANWAEVKPRGPEGEVGCKVNPETREATSSREEEEMVRRGMQVRTGEVQLIQLESPTPPDSTYLLLENQMIPAHQTNLGVEEPIGGITMKRGTTARFGRRRCSKPSLQ